MKKLISVSLAFLLTFTCSLAAPSSWAENDYSLILGMTAFYGTFLVFCNMVVDILYGVIDPRVRIGGK